jgi:MATE family multidrug resistance protein
MVPLGFGQAATVRVGLAAGRQDHAGVYRSALTALALGITFMAAMAVIMLTFPDVIIGLFLDEDTLENQDVLALGVTFLTFAAFFQVFDAGQVIAMGLLRGLKDTRWPMILAAIAYWLVGLSASAGLAFVAGLGGIGIWSGLILGLVAAASLLIARFFRLHRRLAMAWG